MCQTPCLKLKMREVSLSGVHHLMEEAGYTLEQRMENENWLTHIAQTNSWYFVVSAEISDCQLNMALLRLFYFN